MTAVGPDPEGWRRVSARMGRHPHPADVGDLSTASNTASGTRNTPNFRMKTTNFTVTKTDTT